MDLVFWISDISSYMYLSYRLKSLKSLHNAQIAIPRLLTTF